VREFVELAFKEVGPHDHLAGKGLEEVVSTAKSGEWSSRSIAAISVLRWISVSAIPTKAHRELG